MLSKCKSRLLDRLYKMDNDRLYMIAKLIAESDSIGECWRYTKVYTMEQFERERKRT